MTDDFTDRRWTPVRFTIESLGLVRGDDPYHFVEQTVGVGDTGELLVEGEPPFTVPDGWVLVRVADDLWAPVHPAMVETV